MQKTLKKRRCFLKERGRHRRRACTRYRVTWTGAMERDSVAWDVLFASFSVLV